MSTSPDFKPLGSFILVTQENPNETFKEGGIIIAPDVTKQKPLHGYVVAIGADVEELNRQRNGVEVGDRILFEQYAGKAITIEGKPYLLMSVASVYGIVGETVTVAVT